MKSSVLPGRYRGLTLLELLVAMLLTALLVLGLVQLTTAAGSATQLQDNQASLQDHARFAANLLATSITEAGFSPEPWNAAFDRSAMTSETADHVSAAGDRLVITTWSDRNCFENINPERDADDNPRFFIKESTFDLNSSGQLAHGCRYGPSPGELVTQVRRQGLVPGVESFQCLFGEDTDGDGNVDRWMQAGRWQSERQVLGIQAALLLAGPDAVTPRVSKTYEVLDTRKAARADGKLREVISLTLAIRSRSG